MDLRQWASALPQQPPAPIGPIFTEAVAKLIPEEVSLETFNSVYLQQNGSDAKAHLAVAQVLKMLDAPLGEIESTIFGVLKEGVEVDVKVLSPFVQRMIVC